MPLYLFECVEGHRREVYCHVAEDKGAETIVCPADGSTMGPVLSVGCGLTWFEEGRPRVIENLGHEPVTVRSHREHDRAMKEAGVTWATQGRGRKGQWV